MAQVTAMHPTLEAELQGIASEEGCELVHVEWKGGVLRFILDHPEGVTLEHCEAFSKQASALLDVEDFATGSYVLEVSSPGLDRQLYREDDYHRFVGRSIRITFCEASSSPPKRTVVGVLESIREDRGESTLRVRDRGTGEAVDIPLAGVLIARLEIEI